MGRSEREGNEQKTKTGAKEKKRRIDKKEKQIFFLF